jgi:hypothetical protein
MEFAQKKQKISDLHLCFFGERKRERMDQDFEAMTDVLVRLTRS